MRKRRKEGESSYAKEGQAGRTGTERRHAMKRRGRHYKEVIRSRVISLRLNDEEFLRLKANALRDRTSMSRMVRARMTDLVHGGAPTGTDALAAREV